MPEIRSMMSYLSRMASSTPWIHWLGCPWFSHSVTSNPTLAPAAFSRSMMPFRNGLALLLGIDIIFLPAAHFLASNGSPGATNCGMAVYLARLSLALARPSAAASAAAGAARNPRAAAEATAASNRRPCIVVLPLRLRRPRSDGLDRVACMRIHCLPSAKFESIGRQPIFAIRIGQSQRVVGGAVAAY